MALQSKCPHLLSLSNSITVSTLLSLSQCKPANGLGISYFLHIVCEGIQVSTFAEPIQQHSSVHLAEPIQQHSSVPLLSLSQYNPANCLGVSYFLHIVCEGSSWLVIDHYVELEMCGIAVQVSTFAGPIQQHCSVHLTGSSTAFKSPSATDINLNSIRVTELDQDLSTFIADTHIHDSDKMIKYVKVDIPDCCEYLEVFMEDRQNVVHQRFPISGITKQNRRSDMLTNWKRIVNYRCRIPNPGTDKFRKRSLILEFNTAE
ncbi:hypothetical protein OUZ56_032153 [Daphnia magna]|uniref:Uncharacterized protein n=1 Tax=Daphnia magna TaxID=35525 RepID=A0ABQ9ZWD0_9CRUS|nr:hypothetical protein OUZ56_032153 [Daphnia magna]